MIYELRFDISELSKSGSEIDAIKKRIESSKSRELLRAGQLLQSMDNQIRIIRKSIDARHKPSVKIIYKFEIIGTEDYNKLLLSNESKALKYLDLTINTRERPIVIGFGPAGMFAALTLARYGLRPIVIERGSEMNRRISDVDSYRDSKTKLNTESNIQFGEGGAGTFSDGKLHTGVNSEYIPFILDTFVKHGAPKDILYDSQPHIGTDYLRNVVVGIRNEIIRLGGEVIFDARFTSFDIESNAITAVRYISDKREHKVNTSSVILAIGNSSRDTFRYLFDAGINMESKPFAVGVRIEHLREDIDMAQYGFDSSCYRDVSSASYRLAVDTVTGKKLYTFCMCPGGYVVAGSSIEGHICTNGMSDYRRDAKNSNSALLIPVSKEDYGEGVLDGMYFQDELEKKAYIAAGSSDKAPICSYGALKSHVIDTGIGKVTPSYKPGVDMCNFDSIFQPIIIDTLIDGIAEMGKRIKGFDDPEALLTAVETRSSSPIRINRDLETFVSTNISGLYPCGEGAGYAGGITSSAIDGIKCANALVSS